MTFPDRDAWPWLAAALAAGAVLGVAFAGMSDDSPARVVAAQDETSGLSDQLRRCKAELDECETRTADDYEDDVPA